MPTKITTDKYIYPPRPKTSMPREETTFFKDLGWTAQLKYNGSRCMIKHLPDNSIQLWNRHGERFRTYNTPDWLQEQIRESLYKLGLEPNQYHLLDGELLDQKHAEIKDTIAIWDILVKNSEYLTDTTLNHRYALLRDSISTQETWRYKENDFGIYLTENTFLAKNYKPEDWDKTWDMVHKVNQPFKDRPLLEGLVIKNPSGVLERGWKEANNGDWLVRCRVKTGRHNF